MRTRSSSNLVGRSSPDPTTLNPKRRNHRRSTQPFSIEESPLDTMANQRTMAELLHAPTEGYSKAIVVPPILAEHFELKHIGRSSPDPTTLNPKRRNHRRSTQPFSIEESPLDTMANQRTMAELLHAPTEGYSKAIVVPPILAEHFELKHSLINIMTSDQFFRLEKDNPHDHIRWFNKITSKIKYKDVPNSQTSAVTTAMTAIFKQFQATPPPDFVKSIEEICVTCSGAHPYYQCLAADGNTFLEFQGNIQGYVSAAAVNYNQGNFGYRPLSVANQIRPSGFGQPNVQRPLPSNTIANLKEKTLTDPKLAEYTIKVPPPLVQKSKPPSLRNYVVPPPLVQKSKPPSLRNYVVHQRDPRHPNIPYPLRMNHEKQQEKDEIQIHKFWKMFKQLHINITLADALILIPKYQKMLKALLSNKEKLLELANTPFNENCSTVILKKLPEKLGDPGKFLIPCGFSELKCKALTDLGTSINLMPLSVWKKLGLPELISTRMTLELANRAICTPAGIARDVFVTVEKFTFPADFVIVDYESDPRVLLILGRPFLQTARALIDVQESINMINIYNDSYEDYLEDLFTTNHLSGNPTFSSHTDLTSLEVINPLSGNTTSSSPDHLLEEFADELALIAFPPGNNDLPFDIEFDLREIKYLLNHDLTKEMDSILEDSIDEDNLPDPNNNLVDTILKMFTDEQTLDYSSPPLYDDVDDLVELESGNDGVYDDPFDSKEDKIKESKLLFDELDPSRSSYFLPSPKYDSVLYEDFFEVDALPSTDNKEKVFNPARIVRDIFVPVEKFTFPADFVIVDYESDPRVLLILGRPFLRTARALIDSGNDGVYDDPFDSKEDKIKVSKLLIDELNPPRSSYFLPSPKYDSVLYEDFFEVDALPSTDNKEKVFHPGILIHENLF
nr:hypothetical protein [Tanacetum cinerariifolium]